MAEGGGHPRPGDLIEIFRRGYQHWALYEGDGNVIHVTDVGKAVAGCQGAQHLLNLPGNTKVKKEPLKDVEKNPDKWRVNNKYDRDYTPLPVEKIIQNAEHLTGTAIEYDLITSNCEHLVILLRYDEEISGQVSD
ncbi:HRSL1 enzyme, partial [Acrocephalus arundinaceus]|nr:HRSL1 enzyme [Acrocephalus arundinaceus]